MTTQGNPKKSQYPVHREVNPQGVVKLVQKLDKSLFLQRTNTKPPQIISTNTSMLKSSFLVWLDEALTPKLEAAKRSEADTLLVAWVVWA